MNYCIKKYVYIHGQAIGKISKHYEEMDKHYEEMCNLYEEIDKNMESENIHYNEINKCYELIIDQYESMINYKLDDSKDFFHKCYDEIKKTKKAIQNYNKEIEKSLDKIWDLEDVLQKHKNEIYEHIYNIKNHIDECNHFTKENLINNLYKWEYKYIEVINKQEEKDRVYEKAKYKSCEIAYKLCKNIDYYKKELEEKYMKKIDENIKTPNNESKETDENFKNINQKFKEMDEKIIKLTNTLEINMKIFETLISYLENNDLKCKK